jgi:hypothetical protein
MEAEVQSAVRLTFAASDDVGIVRADPIGYNRSS